MNSADRNRRRALERELEELPTPPPPAALLAKIRGEIPADLGTHRAASRSVASTPWHRRPFVRLAASLAVVAVGLSIAFRIADGRDRAETRSEKLSMKGETAARAGVAPEESAAAAGQASPSPEAAVGPKRVVVESGQGIDENERLSLKEKIAVGPSPASEPPGATSGLASPSPEASVEPRRVVGSGRENARRDELQPRGEAEIRRSPTPSASDAPIPHPDRSAQVAAGRDRDAENLTAPSDSPSASIAVTAESPALDARRRRAPEAAQAEAQRMPSAPETRALLKAAPGAVMDRLSIDERPQSAPPSTGGTAEPNDAAYGDMFFRPVGTNPFVDTAEDRLSTFALDVDTGSWTLTRSYLERGALPPAEAIRVEEFVNAQTYDDPAPRRGDFTLVAEGAPSPFAPPGDYRLLRFAVKGREIDLRDRRPANLTFVVDVSGSMRREDRLGLVQRALGLLVNELGRDDRVALVVYGTRGRVVLRPTRDVVALREAIDSLRPEGSTNAEEGLRLGYDLAGEMYRPGDVNRVILCSDGVANVGATGPESILDRIGNEARRGIELTTVGFGMGNYNDALMERLADQGDGRYHYVDTLAEARRLFVDELTGTLETIARDAKVQVEFDPAVVERWRLVGYENRDVADRDFRNDAVDAGEIGAGHSAVALYEVRLAPRARSRDRLATLRLRWQSAATRRVEETALELRVRDLESGFHRASPNLRRAAIAAELGEMLKGSFYAREASWQTLTDEAYRLERDNADPRTLRKLSDLTELVERAARLAQAASGRAGIAEDE